MKYYLAFTQRLVPFFNPTYSVNTVQESKVSRGENCNPPI